MNNDSTQAVQPPDDYDLRDEYDLTTLQIVARGRYASIQRIGANIRVLDPDVGRAFPTDDEVNRALRLVLEIARIPQGDVR